MFFAVHDVAVPASRSQAGRLTQFQRQSNQAFRQYPVALHKVGAEVSAAAFDRDDDLAEPSISQEDVSEKMKAILLEVARAQSGWR